MFTRQLRVKIDTSSWGRRAKPRWAMPPSQTASIDVGRALLMLGSISTPSGLSPGSPERYWACIRYFSACAVSEDLRLCAPFLDLDPHQKGILSDDFGVAISTSWLIDRLGGVANIVDGRRFIINMGINRPSSNPRLPKVGPSKCPDFVLEDRTGKFHVLECKGTQSGVGYLMSAMRTGQAQKNGIRIAPPLRGENLVIGLSLVGEDNDAHSKLFVVDPEYEPLTTVTKENMWRADEILGRLSLAQALNLSGFTRTAFELAWPEGLRMDSPEIEFLTPGERKTLSMPLIESRNRLRQEIDDGFRLGRKKNSENFAIQQVSFDLPPLRLDSGDMVDRVTVRRGLSLDILESLASNESNARAVTDDRIREASKSKSIKFTQSENSAKLNYRDVFYSEFIFE